jgi:hydroxyacyl-ACP dehydratase HTD2-like protein with hotdog domain
VTLSSFHFRAVHPAFDDGSLHLRAERTDDGSLILRAYDSYGELTTRAEAHIDGDNNSAQC